MTKIIIIGDKDNEMSKRLCQLLEKYGGVLFVCNNEIIDYSIIKADFLIISCIEPDTVYIENSIIIFCEKYDKATKSSHFAKNNVCIYSEEQMNYSYENEIVIGHKKESDVMISSVDENAVTVSVNKPLKKLGGKDILPCEIKVYIRNEIINTNEITVYIVILLLIDKLNDNNLETEL